MNDNDMSAVTTSPWSFSLPQEWRFWGLPSCLEDAVAKLIKCEQEQDVKKCVINLLCRDPSSIIKVSPPPAEASQEAPVCSPLINDQADASLQDYGFWLCHLFVIAAVGILRLDHKLKIIFWYAVIVGCIWFCLKSRSIMKEDASTNHCFRKGKPLCRDTFNPLLW